MRVSRRVAYDWVVLKRAGILGSQDVGSAEDEQLNGAGDGGVSDSYMDRLIKFVPAEVLAFYVAAQSILETDGQRWVTLVLGLVLAAATVTNVRAMTWWTIPLSWIAFVVWAFGTTNVDEELFGWKESWSSLLLVAGVFLVPAIDRFLASLARRR